MLYSKRLAGPTVLGTTAALAGTVPAGKRWVIQTVSCGNKTGAAKDFNLFLGNGGTIDDVLYQRSQIPAFTWDIVREVRLVYEEGEDVYWGASGAASVVASLHGYELDA